MTDTTPVAVAISVFDFVCGFILGYAIMWILDGILSRRRRKGP